MTDSEYFALNAVNASTLKKYATMSPYEAKWSVSHNASTAALLTGSAVHSMTLRSGPEVLRMESKTRSSAAGRAEFEQITNAGKIGLLADEYDDAAAMTKSLTKLLDVYCLRENAIVEKVILWQNNETKCKAKIDMMITEGWLSGNVIDIKTTSSELDDESLGKAVLNYGYHIQDAWYSMAFQELTGQWPEFRFAFVKKTPPYAARIVRLDDQSREIGMQTALTALNKYNECAKNNDWPGPSQDEIITLPRWAKQ